MPQDREEDADVTMTDSAAARQRGEPRDDSPGATKSFHAGMRTRGTTLKSWLQEKPRSVAEILSVFAQAGQGLAAAHAAGLVHRDFKPSNVLVGRDGRVLVSDFGLARSSAAASEASTLLSEDALYQTITLAGSIVGTPAYMAPEQLAGSAVDARADQFSFCSALWRALFGTPVYSEQAWQRSPNTLPRVNAVGTWLPRGCDMSAGRLHRAHRRR